MNDVDKEAFYRTSLIASIDMMSAYLNAHRAGPKISRRSLHAKSITCLEIMQSSLTGYLETVKAKLGAYADRVTMCAYAESIGREIELQSGKTGLLLPLKIEDAYDPSQIKAVENVKKLVVNVIPLVSEKLEILEKDPVGFSKLTQDDNFGRFSTETKYKNGSIRSEIRNTFL